MRHLNLLFFLAHTLLLSLLLLRLAISEILLDEAWFFFTKPGIVEESFWLYFFDIPH